MKEKQTLNWLYKSSKSQLPLVFLLALMRCGNTVLGVTFALTSKLVIDAAVAHNMQSLKAAAFRLLAIIVAQIIIRLIGQSLEVVAKARLQVKLRSHMFGSILRRDYSAATAYHSGDLLTRLNNDTSIVSGGVISLIPSVLALLVGLSYALFSLIRLDKSFALILLVGGIILLVLISLFRNVMKKLHKRVQETEAKVRSFFQESLGSLLMVKVFGIEETVSQKSDVLQGENYTAQMQRRNLSIFASSSLGFIFSIGSLYALVSSSFRLYYGSITFGTLTAILQLVGQIQSPFAGLSGVMPQYYAVLASAERIIEIENLPAEPENHQKLEPQSSYEKLRLIGFENISFGYGRDAVLEGADLQINKGDFAVIGGISGIGKSTLIKLLLGVFTPQKGNIYLYLGDEKLPAGKFSRPLFSYVPQGNLLLSGTIRESLSLVQTNASDEDIMKAAEIGCAAEFIKKLPEGLDTYIGEKGAGLSEGQIQRLAVTRAILSDAPIILLDEATSALDEETEARLLNNIKNMKNKTCIIISHKRAAFDVCNKKIYIENKKIRVEE